MGETFYKDTHVLTASIEITVKGEVWVWDAGNLMTPIKLGHRVSDLVYIVAHRRGLIEDW